MISCAAIQKLERYAHLGLKRHSIDDFVMTSLKDPKRMNVYAFTHEETWREAKEAILFEPHPIPEKETTPHNEDDDASNSLSLPPTRSLAVVVRISEHFIFSLVFAAAFLRHHLQETLWDGVMPCCVQKAMVKLGLSPEQWAASGLSSCVEDPPRGNDAAATTPTTSSSSLWSSTPSSPRKGHDAFLHELEEALLSPEVWKKKQELRALGSIFPPSSSSEGQASGADDDTSDRFKHPLRLLRLWVALLRRMALEEGDSRVNHTESGSSTSHSASLDPTNDSSTFGSSSSSSLQMHYTPAFTQAVSQLLKITNDILLLLLLAVMTATTTQADATVVRLADDTRRHVEAPCPLTPSPKKRKETDSKRHTRTTPQESYLLLFDEALWMMGAVSKLYHHAAACHPSQEEKEFQQGSTVSRLLRQAMEQATAEARRRENRKKNDRDHEAASPPPSLHTRTPHEDETSKKKSQSAVPPSHGMGRRASMGCNDTHEKESPVQSFLSQWRLRWDPNDASPLSSSAPQHHNDDEEEEEEKDLLFGILQFACGEVLLPPPLSSSPSSCHSEAVCLLHTTTAWWTPSSSSSTVLLLLASVLDAPTAASFWDSFTLFQRLSLSYALLSAGGWYFYRAASAMDTSSFSSPLHVADVDASDAGVEIETNHPLTCPPSPNSPPPLQWAQQRMRRRAKCCEALLRRECLLLQRVACNPTTQLVIYHAGDELKKAAALMYMRGGSGGREEEDDERGDGGGHHHRSHSTRDLALSYSLHTYVTSPPIDPAVRDPCTALLLRLFPSSSSSGGGQKRPSVPLRGGGGGVSPMVRVGRWIGLLLTTWCVSVPFFYASFCTNESKWRQMAIAQRRAIRGRQETHARRAPPLQSSASGVSRAAHHTNDDDDQDAASMRTASMESRASRLSLLSTAASMASYSSFLSLLPPEDEDEDVLVPQEGDARPQRGGGGGGEAASFSGGAGFPTSSLSVTGNSHLPLLLLEECVRGMHQCLAAYPAAAFDGYGIRELSWNSMAKCFFFIQCTLLPREEGGRRSSRKEEEEEESGGGEDLTVSRSAFDHEEEEEGSTLPLSSSSSSSPKGVLLRYHSLFAPTAPLLSGPMFVLSDDLQYNNGLGYEVLAWLFAKLLAPRMEQVAPPPPPTIEKKRKEENEEEVEKVSAEKEAEEARRVWYEEEAEAAPWEGLVCMGGGRPTTHSTTPHSTTSLAQRQHLDMALSVCLSMYELVVPQVVDHYVTAIIRMAMKSLVVLPSIIVSPPSSSSSVVVVGGGGGGGASASTPSPHAVQFFCTVLHRLGKSQRLSSLVLSMLSMTSLYPFFTTAAAASATTEDEKNAFPPSSSSSSGGFLPLYLLFQLPSVHQAYRAACAHTMDVESLLQPFMTTLTAICTHRPPSSPPLKEEEEKEREEEEASSSSASLPLPHPVCLGWLLHVLSLTLQSIPVPSAATRTLFALMSELELVLTSGFLVKHLRTVVRAATCHATISSSSSSSLGVTHPHNIPSPLSSFASAQEKGWYTWLLAEGFDVLYHCRALTLVCLSDFGEDIVLLEAYVMAMEESVWKVSTPAVAAVGGCVGAPTHTTTEEEAKEEEEEDTWPSLEDFMGLLQSSSSSAEGSDAAVGVGMVSSAPRATIPPALRLSLLCLQRLTLARRMAVLRHHAPELPTTTTSSVVSSVGSHTRQEEAAAYAAAVTSLVEFVLHHLSSSSSSSRGGEETRTRGLAERVGVALALHMTQEEWNVLAYWCGRGTTRTISSRATHEDEKGVDEAMAPLEAEEEVVDPDYVYYADCVGMSKKLRRALLALLEGTYAVAQEEEAEEEGGWPEVALLLVEKKKKKKRSMAVPFMDEAAEEKDPLALFSYRRDMLAAWVPRALHSVGAALLRAVTDLYLRVSLETELRTMAAALRRSNGVSLEAEGWLRTHTQIGFALDVLLQGYAACGHCPYWPALLVRTIHHLHACRAYDDDDDLAFSSSSSPEEEIPTTTTQKNKKRRMAMVLHRLQTSLLRLLHYVVWSEPQSSETWGALLLARAERGGVPVGEKKKKRHGGGVHPDYIRMLRVPVTRQHDMASCPSASSSSSSPTALAIEEWCFDDELALAADYMWGRWRPVRWEEGKGERPRSTITPAKPLLGSFSLGMPPQGDENDENAVSCDVPSLLLHCLSCAWDSAAEENEEEASSSSSTSALQSLVMEVVFFLYATAVRVGEQWDARHPAPPSPPPPTDATPNHTWWWDYASGLVQAFCIHPSQCVVKGGERDPDPTSSSSSSSVGCTMPVLRLSRLRAFLSASTRMRAPASLWDLTTTTTTTRGGGHRGTTRLPPPVLSTPSTSMEREGTIKKRPTRDTEPEKKGQGGREGWQNVWKSIFYALTSALLDPSPAPSPSLACRQCFHQLYAILFHRAIEMLPSSSMDGEEEGEVVIWEPFFSPPSPPSSSFSWSREEETTAWDSRLACEQRRQVVIQQFHHTLLAPPQQSGDTTRLLSTFLAPSSTMAAAPPHSSHVTIWLLTFLAEIIRGYGPAAAHNGAKKTDKREGAGRRTPQEIETERPTTTAVVGRGIPHSPMVCLAHVFAFGGRGVEEEEAPPHGGHPHDGSGPLSSSSSPIKRGDLLSFLVSAHAASQLLVASFAPSAGGGAASSSLPASLATGGLALEYFIQDALDRVLNEMTSAAVSLSPQAYTTVGSLLIALHPHHRKRFVSFARRRRMVLPFTPRKGDGQEENEKENEAWKRSSMGGVVVDAGGPPTPREWHVYLRRLLRLLQCTTPSSVSTGHVPPQASRCPHDTEEDANEEANGGNRARSLVGVSSASSGTPAVSSSCSFFLDGSSLSASMSSLRYTMLHLLTLPLPPFLYGGEEEEEEEGEESEGGRPGWPAAGVGSGRASTPTTPPSRAKRAREHPDHDGRPSKGAAGEEGAPRKRRWASEGGGEEEAETHCSRRRTPPLRPLYHTNSSFSGVRSSALLEVVREASWGYVCTLISQGMYASQHPSALASTSLLVPSTGRKEAERQMETFASFSTTEMRSRGGGGGPLHICPPSWPLSVAAMCIPEEREILQLLSLFTRQWLVEPKGGTRGGGGKRGGGRDHTSSSFSPFRTIHGRSSSSSMLWQRAEQLPSLLTTLLELVFQQITTGRYSMKVLHAWALFFHYLSYHAEHVGEEKGKNNNNKNSHTNGIPSAFRQRPSRQGGGGEEAHDGDDTDDDSSEKDDAEDNDTPTERRQTDRVGHEGSRWSSSSPHHHPRASRRLAMHAHQQEQRRRVLTMAAITSSIFHRMSRSSAYISLFSIHHEDLDGVFADLFPTLQRWKLANKWTPPIRFRDLPSSSSHEADKAGKPGRNAPPQTSAAAGGGGVDVFRTSLSDLAYLCVGAGEGKALLRQTAQRLEEMKAERGSDGTFRGTRHLFHVF